jgi:AcrR family transcriptional regulator
LPLGLVSETQRARLLAGALEAVAARGYSAMTVEHVVREASVSRMTFNEFFANKEERVLAAYDLIIDWLGERIAAAAEGIEDWPDSVGAVVEAILAIAAADPRIVRLCAILLTPDLTHFLIAPFVDGNRPVAGASVLSPPYAPRLLARTRNRRLRLSRRRDLRRALAHRQPQSGRRDGRLPGRDVRLPAAGHRRRHQLARRRPGIFAPLLGTRRFRDPRNGAQT